VSVLIAQADARRLPLRDESVHLIVTSPPYNAKIRYDRYEDWLPWDEYWHGLIEPSLRECYRVLTHGGRIAVNIANVVRSPGPEAVAWSTLTVTRIWAMLEEVGFLPREHLTWIKTDAPDNVIAKGTAWGSWLSASNPVLRATAEPVFIASKGSHAREPGRSCLTAAEFKAWTRNAWYIPGGHPEQYLDHPAKFPPELPRRLIKLYSYVGDVVCDPFAGSGTTVRAARNEGRHGIGFDFSARYCRMAAGRSSQATLFEAVS
jgi:DNA modification methylase